MINFFKQKLAINQEKVDQTEELVLNIDGMHCTNCALTIDADLEDLPGVIKARTHYAKSSCSVEYDPKQVSVEKIKEVIRASGYSLLE